MLVIVNNKEVNIGKESTVMDLINLLNYHRSVAVFINGRQLLQSEYEIYKLKENDVIRIIKPLGGG